MPSFQSVSFVRRGEGPDRTGNDAVAAGLERLAAWVRGDARAARLETTARAWQLVLAPGRPARLVAHAPRRTAPPVRAHDEARARRLGPSAADWRRGLGLEDDRGRPAPGRADKLRQLERYADILSHLVDDLGWKAGERRVVADMGAGRGHLTFAAWHLLRRERGLDAQVLGVERRPELAEAAEALARQLGCEGLTFRAGAIGTADLPPLDGLIALHACDTATDDAIRRGLAAGAPLIVIAPCCHHELRPLLGAPAPLEAILRHGLMKERLAEWVTDGLRGLRLEAAGYRVKMIDFIPAEHTPKNLMIAAVRGAPAADAEAARRRLAEIAAFFGLPERILTADEPGAAPP